MQPPIPSGTILQNRYHLIRILGQGGFGRTYLAEDRGRFNEPCALKELIPANVGGYALEKSRELFQREAAILYQLQHPQIPQFRAAFEENQRLFLVQDYVEGKTYRALLQERQAQGRAFDEAEIVRWLQQVLPVLEHIHAKGIVHRDIAPDNIIQRAADGLPVLIDFGVVKDIATRVQAPDATVQATTVGKLGYAPSEQLQSGRAYPNSDLYALAVSAVVLLTGKEPQVLFDDSQLQWNWQQWASASPEFARIIDRMLSYKPGDRYQTARDALNAIAPLAPHAPIANTPTPEASVSQMATVAVGHRPEPASQSHRAPNRSHAAIPPSSDRSVWDNPAMAIALGILLAIIAGFGSWALVNSLADAPEEVSSPEPSPEPTPTPTPSPTPKPPEREPVTYQQRFRVPSDRAVTATGTLKGSETINYRISAKAGQRLRAVLPGEGVLMTVLDPDGNPLPNARRVPVWEGMVTQDGEYIVQLSPVQGVEQSDYTLEMTRSEPEPEPTPTPSPSPTPTPTPTPTPDAPSQPRIDTESVTIPPGQTDVQVRGTANPKRIKRYLVNVEQGQVLAAEILEGAVALRVSFPDGEVVPDAEKVVFWQAEVPRGGEYQIDVLATQEIDFELSINVRDPE